MALGLVGLETKLTYRRMAPRALDVTSGGRGAFVTPVSQSGNASKLKNSGRPADTVRPLIYKRASTQGTKPLIVNVEHSPACHRALTNARTTTF